MEENQSLELVPAAEACHWLDQVTRDAQRLAQAIRSYDDEALLATRETAEALNKASWIVITACDHEIMSRANRVSNRREGDKTQTGIYATAARQAKATGLNPTTILRNATIYANFGNILTGNDPESLFLVETLQDKGYWDAAAHSPSMHDAIRFFATQKAASPKFTVREAWRWVNEQKAPPMEAQLPSLQENEAAEAALQLIKQGFDLLNQTTANRLRGQLKGYLEEIEWELRLPPCSIMERLYDLIEQGYDEIDIIKERTSWPRDWVVAWFKRMEAEDWVKPFEKPRVEGARGAARKGYVLTPAFKKALSAYKKSEDPVQVLAPDDWRIMRVE